MKDKMFIGIVATLLIGVPITMLSLVYFADKVTSLVIALVLCLLIVVSLILLITRYREPIFKKVFGRASRDIKHITEDVRLAGTEYANGNIGEGTIKATHVAQSILARIAWVRLRQWMFSVAIGLFVGFAALLGSVLVWKQNKILTDQNKKLNDQIQLANRQFNYTSKQQIEKEIIEDQHLLSQRRMFNGLRDINNQYILKRLIINRETSDSLEISGVYKAEKPMLRALDLSYSDFLSFNAKNIEFNNVNWNNSLLDGCRFIKCDFRETAFSKESFGQAFGTTSREAHFREKYKDKVERDHKKFQYSELQNCDFDGCVFDGVDFRGTILATVNFNQSEFVGVKVDSTTVILGGIRHPQLQKIASEKHAITDEPSLTKRIKLLEADLGFYNYSEYVRLKELYEAYFVEEGQQN